MADDPGDGPLDLDSEGVYQGVSLEDLNYGNLRDSEGSCRIETSETAPSKGVPVSQEEVYEGGCYCGALRYKAPGPALMKGECYCRECQYISGGGPNVVLCLPEATFKYSKGSPKTFKRADLENPVVRDFCGECGTHIAAHAPGMPMAIVKVGTLDDPALYPGPDMAIYLCDRQSYHHVAEGVATFDKTPG